MFVFLFCLFLVLLNKMKNNFYLNANVFDEDLDELLNIYLILDEDFWFNIIFS